VTNPIIKSNFKFIQGEAVLIEEPHDGDGLLVRSGIVINSSGFGITAEIIVHMINFDEYHDTLLTNEKARKATGLNPGERTYTYENKKIDFIDIKNGKVKLFRITGVEEVFVKFIESEASENE